jgi:hypothetical protein
LKGINAIRDRKPVNEKEIKMSEWSEGSQGEIKREVIVGSKI